MVDKLVQLIKALEELDVEPNEFGFYEQETHPLIVEISYSAVDLLIDGNGKCNWDLLDDMSAAGYPVSPIEKDRFGWLIAGIHLKNGIIPYG
jgi:hypothetical protein